MDTQSEKYTTHQEALLRIVEDKDEGGLDLEPKTEAFANAVRDALKDLSFSEQLREIGDLWKNGPSFLTEMFNICFATLGSQPSADDLKATFNLWKGRYYGFADTEGLISKAFAKLSLADQKDVFFNVLDTATTDDMRTGSISFLIWFMPYFADKSLATVGVAVRHTAQDMGWFENKKGVDVIRAVAELLKRS